MKSPPSRRRALFAPLPDQPCLDIAWPTPNHCLFTRPDAFYARTRINLKYGRPGWTRDCGRRPHRGCDIAPVHASPTGETRRVYFTDCQTDTEFPSDEPSFTPHDPVFCVFDGTVDEAVHNEQASDFGRHVVVQHHWPDATRTFYTLYAHLASVEVTEGELAPQGHRIGIMGQSSRIPDARNWMAIAPHLHFEVWNHRKQPLDPEAFLRTHLRDHA